jgi:hypothetical protein
VGGALGAAVGAGLLLGLDAGQIEQALRLAVSGACGLSSHHREPWHQIKSLNHGRAAEAGVLSALLAQEGFHGPTEVLTIEHGFFNAFLGLPGVSHEVVDGLGNHYLMRQIAYKRYPVGGPRPALGDEPDGPCRGRSARSVAYHSCGVCPAARHCHRGPSGVINILPSLV